MLDLFGGSGSVGLEALSRGAQLTQFIELNSKAYAILKDNIDKSGCQENARLLKADAFKYLHLEKELRFDYIFIAPPQYHSMWKEALLQLDREAQLLVEDGWIIGADRSSRGEAVEMANAQGI